MTPACAVTSIVQAVFLVATSHLFALKLTIEATHLITDMQSKRKTHAIDSPPSVSPTRQATEGRSGLSRSNHPPSSKTTGISSIILPRSDLMSGPSQSHTARPEEVKAQTRPRKSQLSSPQKTSKTSRRQPLNTPLPSVCDSWWSEVDITGHELDLDDPGDDGEGINGIGFVPTPALAALRAEKRRKQIIDWRARENKEARIQRGRKRNEDEDLIAHTAIQAEKTRKKVRFDTR